MPPGSVVLVELPFGLVVPVVLPPEPLVKKATSYIEVNIRQGSWFNDFKVNMYQSLITEGFITVKNTDHAFKL